VLVFRPGAAPNAPNVFSTVMALAAAAFAVQGPKTVFIDPTYAPAVIPAGSWNLGADTELAGDEGEGSITLLTGAPEAVLRGVTQVRDLLVVSQGTSAFLPLPPRLGGVAFSLWGSATLRADGPGAVLELTGAGLLVPLMYGASALAHGVGPAINLPVAGSVLQIVTYDTAFVDQDTLALAAGSQVAGVQLASPAASASPNQPRCPTGVLHVEPGALPQGIQYFPTDPSKWAQTGMRNEQQALDRLAAAVSGLLGGPIP